MSVTLNGLTVATMRWHAPWSGVWTADIELTSDAEVLPTGPAAIVSDDGLALVGTVLSAEQFGELRRVRVVGGGGGWSKTVRAQHYHSPVGVQLAVLATTTASSVGEIATVLVPQSVGQDFVRRVGPASQIFSDAGVDWWIGTDGVTRIGVRPPVVAPPSVNILSWDGEARTVTFDGDVLVEPGTVLVDDRFGTKVVHEVDADISDASIHGTMHVEDAAPSTGALNELVDGLAELARMGTKPEFSRLYEYRVVAMQGDRVELQAVSKTDGMPDLNPASVWAGISGYKAQLRPSSSVLVGFIGGDPGRPFLAAYEPPENDGWRPVTLDLDALTLVTIGGDTATGVATMQSQAQLMAAIAALCVALQPFANFPTISGLSGGTSAAVAGAAATLGALTALPSNYSLKVRAA